MNVFAREMRANRKSLIVWCAAVLFMVVAGMSKYGGFTTESGAMLNDLMAGMPKSLQAMMGVGTLDLSTATGYFGMLYLYLVLMTTVHAVMLGSTIIAKEERDLTAEFLLAKPISRAHIVTAKLAAAFVNILILNIVTIVSSLVTIAQFNNDENAFSGVVLLMIGMLILQLLFMLLGAAIAAISRKPHRAAALSTGILLSTFLLSIIIDVSGKIDGFKYLTPFKYFEAKDILGVTGFNAVLVILSLAFIVIMITATYKFYQKRDLQL